MNTPRKKLISVAVLAYNEEVNLPILYGRLTKVMQSLEDRYDYEVILLDNCSVDGTQAFGHDVCEKDPHWRYVRYSRNFGAEASLLAGIDFGEGDAVINLYSDLQDPPELIPDLIQKWEEGYQHIYGRVRDRNDFSWIKTLGAKVAYKMIYTLTECKITPDATDFRLLDREMVLVLRTLRESDRYMRGLVHWVGFRSVGIPYDRAPREHGKATGSLLFCVSVAFNAIVSFSSRPLQLAMVFGFAVMCGSVLLAIYQILVTLLHPPFLHPAPQGITSVIVLLLFIVGMNSLFLGIIGTYVGRIYNQTKQRPIYIVQETRNIKLS